MYKSYTKNLVQILSHFLNTLEMAIFCFTAYLDKIGNA